MVVKSEILDDNIQRVPTVHDPLNRTPDPSGLSSDQCV